MKEANISTLSPLEDDVLHVLWPDKKLRVREIYTILKKKRKVALTSICVILDRLHKSRQVDRLVETGRGGTRYVYFPTGRKKEFEHQVVETTVNKLIEQFGSTAVSYFTERFSKRVKR